MPKSVNSRRRLPWKLLIAIAATAAAGVWWYTAPVHVTTMPPVRGDAAEVVYATGTVEPRFWAKVSALARRRIVEICDCEGKLVSKGEVLARLDDLEERGVLAELEARRKRLQEDADRLRLLVESNAASRVAYDDKLTQLREYDARIQAQKARIDDLMLRSPIDGVVLRRDGQVGEVAGATSSDVLFWVGQPTPLRINAEVNEEDIPKIKPGQHVLLRHEGFPAGPLAASIDEITPKGDPATKTFRVYFELPDDTPLKIGMSIEANVVVREAKNVLLLPIDALRDGRVGIVEDGRIRRVQVATGIKGTRHVEIIAGLGEGQAVVVPARPDLKDGQRVIPVASAAP